MSLVGIHGHPMLAEKVVNIAVRDGAEVFPCKYDRVHHDALVAGRPPPGHPTRHRFRRKLYVYTVVDVLILTALLCCGVM